MIIKNLSKQYDGKTVVDDVTFHIPKGKVISMIGPNVRDPGKALEALHARAPAVKCRLIPYRAVGSGGLLLAVQCGLP